MVVERRFLVASSLARLIQRESGAPTRICEGHFTPQGGRRQLVRVERDRAVLVLLNQDEGGQPNEEQAEVPHSHAEALIDVAAGAVAFDRLPVRVGGDVEAVLDRFVVPQGVDILTVTIKGDPRAFAPPLWADIEVTEEPGFDHAALAVNGIPPMREPDISNGALEALLDTLEGRGSYRFRARPVQGPAELSLASPPRTTTDASQSGRPRTTAEAAPATATLVTPLQAVVSEPAAEAATSEPSPPTLVEVTPAAREAESEGGRRPALRPAGQPTGQGAELDEEIARLARTLAPRTQRS